MHLWPERADVYSLTSPHSASLRRHSTHRPVGNSPETNMLDEAGSSHGSEAGEKKKKGSYKARMLMFFSGKYSLAP